jgi:hypothetical protein
MAIFRDHMSGRPGPSARGKAARYARICRLPAWILALAVVALWSTARPVAQFGSAAWPLTRPEATNYAETSRYDDVVAFMKAAAGAAPQIHLTSFGYSFEGRALPLAVIGAPNASPEAVLATGKTRIYIQGNIHAGEVEGKEALLWLLRSIAKGERAPWFDSVVLLIAPIYNADGNERVNLRNRGAQHGPIGGMGQRANAQNLDLNRDCTKLDSPEARSLALLMTRYDPHIAIDLHTTNGSRHGYHITYQSPLHPSTSPGIMRLLRQELLPAVTRASKEKHGWEFFYYGNFSRQGERAWYTDGSLYLPRYTQSYFGVRNRLGILVETYSYDTFEDRIKSNYSFIEEVVNYAARHGDAIRKVTTEADRESIVGKEIGVRARLVKDPEPVAILLGDAVEERNPYVDRPMLRRVKTNQTETMPHYATMEATETATAPRAYIVPPQLMRVLDRLEGHGIKTQVLDRARTIAVERYRIESSTVAAQEFQARKARTVTGKWEQSELEIPAGSVIVPMDQPLARLAFVLLEPRSEDGLLAWALMEEVMDKQPEHAPVMRTFSELAKTTADQ